MTIRVSIPIRVRNVLNNSQGVSRAGMFARASERKKHRGITMLVMRAALRGHDVLPCVVTLTRVAPSNGLDDDALPASCKSCRDGIADALGLKSDRDPRVTWRYEQRRGPARVYLVEVVIEKREAA